MGNNKKALSKEEKNEMFIESFLGTELYPHQKLIYKILLKYNELKAKWIRYQIKKLVKSLVIGDKK